MIIELGHVGHVPGDRCTVLELRNKLSEVCRLGLKVEEDHQTFLDVGEAEELIDHLFYSLEAMGITSKKARVRINQEACNLTRQFWLLFFQCRYPGRDRSGITLGTGVFEARCWRIYQDVCLLAAGTIQPERSELDIITTIIVQGQAAGHLLGILRPVQFFKTRLGRTPLWLVTSREGAAPSPTR